MRQKVGYRLEASKREVRKWRRRNVSMINNSGHAHKAQRRHRTIRVDSLSEASTERTGSR